VILVRKAQAGGDSFGNQWDDLEIKELPDAVAYELLALPEGGFTRPDAPFPGVVTDGVTPDGFSEVTIDGIGQAPGAMQTVAVAELGDPDGDEPAGDEPAGDVDPPKAPARKRTAKS
jgi:hypothetical protein